MSRDREPEERGWTVHYQTSQGVYTSYNESEPHGDDVRKSRKSRNAWVGESSGPASCRSLNLDIGD